MYLDDALTYHSHIISSQSQSQTNSLSTYLIVSSNVYGVHTLGVPVCFFFFFP